MPRVPLAESGRAPEQFDISRFGIIAAVHAISIGAAFHASVEAVAAFIALHLFFSLFGVSLSLHRLFSHRSFEPRSKVLRNVLAGIATLCFQGGPIQWAAVHRAHHRNTEKHGDAHSAARGFFWSHIGWLVFRNENGFSYLRNRRTVADLNRDAFLAWIDRSAVRLNVWALVLTYGAAHAADRLDLFFWTMPLRIVSVWHATWLINSIGHGVLPFRTVGARDAPRYTNSRLVSLLLPGEGFHALHHARPGDAIYEPMRHSLDFAGWVLRAGARLGIWTLRT